MYIQHTTIHDGHYRGVTIKRHGHLLWLTKSPIKVNKHIGGYLTIHHNPQLKGSKLSMDRHYYDFLVSGYLGKICAVSNLEKHSR